MVIFSKQVLEAPFQKTTNIPPTRSQSNALIALQQQDQSIIKQGTIIQELLNYGNTAFIPDMLFTSLMKSTQLAQQLYGQRLLTLATGYSIATKIGRAHV